MKPLHSAITGAVSLAQRVASSTGQELGEIEPAKSVTVSESERRVWLLAHTPEETDRLLRASLTSSLSVGLEEVGEWRFPSDKPAYKLVTGVFATGDRNNFPAAWAKVSAAMVSPTKDQIEEWLAMLQAATAGGRKSENAGKLALAVYVNALAEYPADVVKAACERAMASEEWFPPLSRLLAMCKEAAAGRQLMLETFARAR